MALKTNRTEHAGYLTGSDAQKEYDNKRILKWDSKKRRRQYDKEIVCQAFADWPLYLTRYPPCHVCEGVTGEEVWH